MKKYLFLLLIPMLAFMVPAKKKKVIFFGDSITQAGIRPGGYIPRIDTLAQKAGRGQDFDWIGAGVSGNKVYDLYLRLEEDVLDKKPDIVLIYIGVNDVWHKDKRGTGTDFDKFGKFYGAGSYLDAGYKSEASIWGLYAMYNPLYRDRLDSALHQEIDKAISGGFTSDELSKSVDSWLEQNKTSLGMNNMLASMINRYLRQGRDLTEVTAMENKVKALDVKTVNEALRKYFDKSKMIIINSGDFRKKGF